jgi:lysophospholipase L1-like esterase
MLNHRPKISFKSKVFFIIFGVILFFLLLEIILGFSAGISRIITNIKRTEFSQKSVKDENSFRILCLGDSYTYGAGTSFEYSYPAQLEKLLKQKYGEKIQVNNLGSPGGNSYRVLNILIENIHQVNPDLIILMVGANNLWNLEGSERFYQKSILSRLRAEIFRLCTYKLLKILTLGLREKLLGPKRNKTNYSVNAQVTQQPDHIDQVEWEQSKKDVDYYRKIGRSDLAIKEIKLMLKKYPQALDLNTRLLVFLREAAEYDLALKTAKKIIENTPTDPKRNAYIHLEMLFIYRAQKNWRLAREEINYALEDISNIQLVSSELRGICNSESGLDYNAELKSIYKFIGLIHGQEGQEILNRIIETDRDSEKIVQILEFDLQECIKIAVQNKAKLLLMTYPFMSFSNNSAIRKIALNNSVELIDNEIVFEKEPARDSLFALDGHCNQKGYALIAENIYSSLIKTGVLPAQE